MFNEIILATIAICCGIFVILNTIVNHISYGNEGQKHKSTNMLERENKWITKKGFLY